MKERLTNWWTTTPGILSTLVGIFMIISNFLNYKGVDIYFFDKNLIILCLYIGYSLIVAKDSYLDGFTLGQKDTVLKFIKFILDKIFKLFTKKV